MIGIEYLGLNNAFLLSKRDANRLRAPVHHLMLNGALPLSRTAFSCLREYSTSLPTGTGEGKVWKARNRKGWYLGRYGAPYPDGHEYAGQVRIDWFPIYVEGEVPRFPSELRIAPAPMRGRPAPIPPGFEEGDFCGRINGRSETCLGRIEYRKDESDGRGCSCHISPPCGYCTSTMPECPACGWREEE